MKESQECGSLSSTVGLWSSRKLWNSYLRLISEVYPCLLSECSMITGMAGWMRDENSTEMRQQDFLSLREICHSRRTPSIVGVHPEPVGAIVPVLDFHPAILTYPSHVAPPPTNSLKSLPPSTLRRQNSTSSVAINIATPFARTEYERFFSLYIARSSL